MILLYVYLVENTWFLDFDFFCVCVWEVIYNPAKLGGTNHRTVITTGFFWLFEINKHDIVYFLIIDYLVSNIFQIDFVPTDILQFVNCWNFLLKFEDTIELI